MTDEELVARHPRRLRIDPVLGLVKQCTVCEEWWTATRDFFGSAPHGHGALGLHAHCHACSTEAKRRQRQVARA